MNSLRARFSVVRPGGFALAVDAAIPLRGVTGVYGPSGCGKTTLLYALAGLAELDGGGEVALGERRWHNDSRALPLHRRAIGFVFQDPRLFPHLDVRGNLRFALSRRRQRAGPAWDEVCRALALEGLLGRPVQALSRGQEQRVAIARALLSAPDILFLDEPLANLDAAARADILNHLERLLREFAIPAVYVSHDMEELARLADYLLLMTPGRIAAAGPLAELASRLDLPLAREEQAAAILQATFAEYDGEYQLGKAMVEGQAMQVASLRLPPGSPLRLRVPARDVSICLEPPGRTSILNVLEVQVDAVEQTTGPRALARLRVGGQFLIARITRKSAEQLALKPGDKVYAQIKSAALVDPSANLPAAPDNPAS